LLLVFVVGCSDNKGVYFNKNNIVVPDFEITITDYRIVPAGSDDTFARSDKAVIVFEFDIYNKNAGDCIDAGKSWKSLIKVFQDDVELVDLDSFETMICMSKGGTKWGAVPYELNNLESPVIIKASLPDKSDPFGEQEFVLSGK